MLLIPPAAFARDKTDTVTLVKGNDVTCEIKSLQRGVLSAKTDSLSDVSIRWEDVTRIRSEFVFEIVLSDRSTHFGTLATAASGGLVLAGSAPAPLHSVVALTPIRSRIANRFDGSIDLGYSFMKSETTTQFNFNGELGYTTRRHSVELQVSNNLLLREDTASTRRFEADLGFNETLSRGNFARVIGQCSINDELNLIQRYLGGGALVRYLVRTNRSMPSAYAGGAYSVEHYAGADRRNNGEALIGLNTQIFRLYSPEGRHHRRLQTVAQPDDVGPLPYGRQRQSQG